MSKAPRTRQASVSPRKKSLVGIVMGSVFLIIGFGLGVWGHLGYKKLDHVKAHWTQATGNVTSFTQRNEESLNVEREERRSQYIVRYSYEADGNIYDAEYTYVYYPNNHNEGQKEATLVFFKKHQKGRVIKVYFNPAKHDECLLEQEVLYSPLAKHLAMGGMGIFVILALLRISIDVLALSRIRRQQPPGGDVLKAAPEE